MKRALSVPALLGLAVLLSSGGVMGLLLIFERAPAEALVERDEKPIHVTVREVHPEQVPVHIQGFGEVAAERTVTISSQVTGKVVEVHPGLIEGGRVPAGEVLFALDPRSFDVQAADARAQLERQQNALLRLQAEARNQEGELQSLKRNGDLAAQHFARATQLYDEGVGSQSAREDAERALINTKNEIDSLGRNLALYPLRIKEAENDIASAQARLDMAEVDLERTRVIAPFDARISEVNLERDEILTAGVPAAILVDDSVLEIAVPLNSRDARQWLHFEARESTNPATWFGEVKHQICPIRWTEGESDHRWEGTLHRVASYDQESRTITVIIRVEGAQILAGDRFPLVEGMFCEVTIPGRAMEGVYRLPPHTVSFENTVFLADGERLKTVPVTVSRIEEEYTYVSDGLQPGDRVITTRLVNPLDQSLLAIIPEAAAAAGP